MKQKLTRIILALAVLAGVLTPAVPVAAAGASISLTSSKSTVASGGTVIIAVYANGGGTPINAVQADLSYPASKLQYIGFSASGSAFEIGASSGGGDGLATLARGTISSVSGSGLVGTVTFKALVGSGSAAIGVAGSSSLVSDGNPVAYGTSGVSVNFGAAAAAAPKAAAAPAPPKDTTAPVITAVKATEVTPYSATITWTTSEPTDSVVEYGLDDKYGLSTSVAAPTTTHSVALNSSFLTPQTLLHYRVKSVDAAGNVATGSDLTFQLPGVPVTVIVRGPNGKPLPGAVVTLDNATGTTDSKGSVTLRAGLGNKKLTTTYQGVTVQKPITVTKSAKPLPPYQLDLAKKPLNPWMLTSIGLFVTTIVLLGIDALLFGSRILAKVTGLRIAKPAPTSAVPATPAPPVAATAAPAPEPEPASWPVMPEEPVTAAEPEPAIVSTDEPLDPLSNVVALMGDEPVKASSLGPDANQKATPLVINLKPLSESEPVSESPAPVPSKPSAPIPVAKATGAHHKAKSSKKKIIPIGGA
ncbi:MAG: Fibronectin, type domain protein [Candidatus Saccharibacteria bacterium]|nr:Fibronectin, type domain protein [Candidatus Saccharibacteria bacterium]